MVVWLDAIHSLITTSGEAKPHPPLGHSELDEIERARKDFEAGRSSSDLATGRHPRVLLWRSLAVGRKHAGAARTSKLSHLRQHPDPTLREAVEREITRTR